MSRAKRTLIGCSGSALLVAVFATIWYVMANVTPTVVLDPVTLPSPNGHDYFVAAYHSMRSPDRVMDVDFDPANLGQDHLRPGEKEALLASNAVALVKAREGLRHACVTPPIDATNADALVDNSECVRRLCALLRLESAVRSEHGDWSAACACSLDSLDLAVVSVRGSTLIGALTAYFSEQRTCATIFPEIEHLDAVDATSAAARIGRILDGRTQPYEVLQGEKRFIQSSLLAQFHQKDWVGAVLELDSGSNRGGLVQRLNVLRFGKRAIFRNATQYMDGLIAHSRDPQHFQRPPEPPDPITSSFAFAGWEYQDTSVLSFCRLAEAMLALRAYRVSHGTYPAALAELGPTLLRTTPEDPFRHGHSLVYRRRGPAYLLYSVGPDRRDDGGTPVARISPRSLRVDPNAVGDIVAGVSTVVSRK